MATTKSQRLVNLVICLRSTTSYLSATQIRQMVQGYDDCENEAAFHRMFERDKKELREVGVPIAQGTSLAPNTPTGYRIAAAEYELPEITLTPEQAGVLAVAAEVWRAGSRGTDAELALGKLTAAGVEPVRDPATSVEVGDAHELATAAVVAEAVASGSALTFSYQAPGSARPSVRSVEPWWTGSRDGRWYLVGHDRDRDAPRTFRLVRMADARVVAGRRTAPVPAHERVLALLDEGLARVDPRVDGEIWVADGRAAELRARATDVRPGEHRGTAGDVLRVSAPLGELAALVAGQGPDAAVLSGGTLAERVHGILSAAAREELA